MAALIMLDLSADVIDHPILLKRVEVSLEMKRKGLTWVNSYLTGRTQFVSMTDITSPDVGLVFWYTTGIRFSTKELLYIYQTSW